MLDGQSGLRPGRRGGRFPPTPPAYRYCGGLFHEASTARCSPLITWEPCAIPLPPTPPHTCVIAFALRRTTRWRTRGREKPRTSERRVSECVCARWLFSVLFSLPVIRVLGNSRPRASFAERPRVFSRSAVMRVRRRGHYLSLTECACVLASARRRI